MIGIVWRGIDEANQLDDAFHPVKIAAKGIAKLRDASSELAKAEGIVFGSPTYMGGPSWQFKKFADASSKPWFGKQWRNKLAAGFTNSATLNGDKFSTLAYFWTLSQQHGMLWAGMGMHPSNAKASTRSDINNLGGYGGLVTASPSDASPDEMVPGDLATARAFGQRIVEVAALIK